jgi:hypothetical protein
MKEVFKSSVNKHQYRRGMQIREEHICKICKPTLLEYAFQFISTVMSSFSRQIPFRPYKPSQFMVHLFTEA